ncbi:unnamed protein product [Adineta steineri]|uniref:Uncharacterized protein n=1 Tax=Adineta steineri TaxID=433720 RepID=A0A815Z4T0_9BILA|nr:unnamed protein product [Adineta steineri]CAF1579633.1 unnamed protein product [Adineta steineri]
MGTHMSEPVLPEPTVTFRRGTTDDVKFGKLIKHVTEVLSTLTSYGNIIPGVGIPVKAGIITYKEGLKWIYTLHSNQSEIISTLIDAKIDKALAEFATSQINAEIKSIENRIIRMEQENISIRERETAVEPALHSCEKILTLFGDENFCFWKVVILSSELLIGFVAIYADVIKRASELLPSNGRHLNSELNRIIETLEKYKRAVIMERLKEVYITARIHPDMYTIRGDGINNLEMLEDLHSKLSPNGKFICSTISDKWIPWDVYFTRDASCEYKSYRNNLQEVYENKFNDVVNRLNNLRTFCNA